MLRCKRLKWLLDHPVKDVKLHFDALWAEMERREPEATLISSFV